MNDGSVAGALEGVAGDAGAGAAAGAAAGGAAAGAADGGADGGAANGAALTSEIGAWLAGLPDDLRNDPDINRYKTAEDAAKGIKETRVWARGRIPLPGADDDAGWTELGQKLRPESADGYAIDVPEGDDGALVKAFQAKAFEIGLPPRWAKAVAEFHNQAQTDALSRLGQGNSDGLKSIELELGQQGYNQRLEAVGNMLSAAGLDSFDAVTALQTAMQSDGKPGAEKAMRLLFALAEKTGELGKVDPANVALRMGALAPQDAQARIDKAMGDRDFMAKAKIAGTPEAAQWNAWNEAAAKRA